MASFVSEFDDMLGSLLSAQYGDSGDSGDWVASGAALSIPCYIEGKDHTVVNSRGQEVAAHQMVVTNELNGLSTKDYRFTLPSQYSPRVELEALAIQVVEDETGPIYEVIYI